MKYSIGKKLVKNFLFIIILTVAIISLFLIVGFRNFYYSNIENELSSRLNLSIDSFEKFYSDRTLEDLILEDTEMLWANTNSEVQILNNDKYVIYDSIGAMPTNTIITYDVKSAENGVKSTFIGSNSYTNDKVMALTGKLRNSAGMDIGYLRFISSLEEPNKEILKTSLGILGLGVVVIAITTVMSLILANSIVKPMEELISVAAKMADGQYKIRSELNTPDEFGQLGKTLNSMAEEILKREQIKNDFISSISHELRTPLTSIKGWAVVLKSAREDEKTLLNDGLNIIENETDRLSKMVEELLDFSRFISGRIQLEKDTLNLTEVLNDIAKQMRPRAELNKIEFQSNIDSEKAILIGDENRIRQLLINLLDNAIKFTSTDGFVRFTSSVLEDSIVILITDNGQGIDKDEIQHVKEKFYKGKHSKSHSGIGLSIADEIANLHQGELNIYSEKNIGTTVKVTLPIVKAQKDEEEN
ncbi:ATP-binding protein [Peptoniphilus asaccharolyticus]